MTECEAADSIDPVISFPDLVFWGSHDFLEQFFFFCGSKLWIDSAFYGFSVLSICYTVNRNLQKFLQ